MELLKKIGGYIAAVILLLAAIAGVLLWEHCKSVVSPRANGESCLTNDECASGNCWKHLECQPAAGTIRKSNGSRCSENWECASGYCASNHVCR